VVALSSSFSEAALAGMRKIRLQFDLDSSDLFSNVRSFYPSPYYFAGNPTIQPGVPSSFIKTFCLLTEFRLL
jgi:hypothetical protein